MTAAEKATELYVKFYQGKTISKKCLIAVDEIINEFKKLNDDDTLPINFEASIRYWKEVKIEIEKI